MNKECIKAIGKKNKSWKKFTKSKRKSRPDEREKWKKFVEDRNFATNLIRKTKSDFENRLADEIKTKEKCFWNYIKSQSKSKVGIPDLIFENGDTVSDDQGKADLFNTFFSSVFSVEDLTSIPDIPPIVDSFLTNFLFNKEEVLNVLTGLNINKSAGPDGIHARVLFELRHEMSTPCR